MNRNSRKNTGRTFFTLAAIGVFFILGVFSSQIILGTTTKPQPTRPSVSYTFLVVAVIDIPQGTIIEPHMVGTYPWLVDDAPPGGIFDATLTFGKLATVELIQGQVITPGMFADPGTLFGGSFAASLIDEGDVAIVIPINKYTGVGFGLQPGDSVDLILNLLITEMDLDFQSREPNDFYALAQDQETGEITFVPNGTFGRIEQDTELLIPLFVVPSENQRPRMVTQMTVQLADVLRIGDWPAQPNSTSSNIQQEPIVGNTNTLLTVGVTPQEAVLIEYMIFLGADISIALRSSGDDSDHGTTAISLDALMEQFRIQLPSKLPYGLAVQPSPTPLPPTPIPSTPDDTGS